MQNIHVKRYQTPGLWMGSIEPEDRSWVVFVDSENQATFWRRTDIQDEDGKVEHAYIDAELPRGVTRVVEGEPHGPVKEPPLPKLAALGPLDFEIEPCTTDDIEWLNRVSRSEMESGKFEEPKTKGFWAKLNARSITCYGETEHEAIRSLMNYVAQLCTAGCMDHTGAPVPGHNSRRYDFVFGES